MRSEPVQGWVMRRKSHEFPNISGAYVGRQVRKVISDRTHRKFFGFIFLYLITTLPQARYWQWNRGVPFYTHNAAMRRGPWKLVRPMITREIIDSASSLKPVLYNLNEDSTESMDLSKRYPEIYEEMKVMLEDWSRKMEADRLKSTSHDLY